MSRRKTDRDALLLLLLFGMLGRRSSAPGPSWQPLPPGPPAPFPPPGTVPRQPEEPDGSLLESFQRAVEETFKGSPIDLEWWRKKLDEWRSRPRPQLPWE